MKNILWFSYRCVYEPRSNAAHDASNMHKQKPNVSIFIEIEPFGF